MSLVSNPDIAVIYPDESLVSQTLTLLIALHGRDYSLCDAVSFVVMRTRNIGDALSTDQHFDEEGTPSPQTFDALSSSMC